MDKIDALELFRSGEMTLQSLGDVMLDGGMSPREVREELSQETKYPIPAGYFGDEAKQDLSKERKIISSVIVPAAPAETAH